MTKIPSPFDHSSHDWVDHRQPLHEGDDFEDAALPESEDEVAHLYPGIKAAQPHAGHHLLLDLYGAQHLQDEAYIQATCEAASRATGATVVSSSFHHFGKGYGVSGIVLLAESHCSIHTWPEYGLATVDVFVCGTCDPHLAVAVFKERLAPQRTSFAVHQRGMIPYGK